MNNKHRKIENHGLFNHKAEDELTQRIPQIQKDVKSYAFDMAQQSRPNSNDPQALFVPKIKGLFETLLQHILRIIGAFSILNQTGESIKAIYDREVAALKKRKAATASETVTGFYFPRR